MEQLVDISYRNKFEVIRDDLRGEIVGGRYSAGAILPPERELTARYGVNRGTISKVLSSLVAEGLVSRKPKVGSMVLDVKSRKVASRLGVLVARSSGHVYEKMTGALVRQIQEHGYFPVLIDMGLGHAVEETLPYIRSHLDAAIAAGPEFIVIDGEIAFPFAWLKERHPDVKNLIFVNRIETGLDFSATAVLADYEMGGYLGAQHLLEAGHTRPWLLFGEERPHNLTSLRLRGVRKAFAERGVPCEASLWLSWKAVEDLPRLLDELLAAKGKPTALFVFSDSEGWVAQRHLEKRGLRLGADYQMVGYYDTPWAVQMEPRLTSISIQEEQLAQEVGRLIANRDFRGQRILVPPKLIVRESTEMPSGECRVPSGEDRNRPTT